MAVKKAALACSVCGSRNYSITANSNRTKRLELNKFCKHCGGAMLAAIGGAPEAVPAEPVAAAPVRDPDGEAVPTVSPEPAAALVGVVAGSLPAGDVSPLVLASAEPVPLATVAVVQETKRAVVATIAGNELQVPLFAVEPEREETAVPAVGNEASSPETVVIVAGGVTERAPEPVLAVEAMPEVAAVPPAATAAGMSQVSAPIDAAVTHLAAVAATAADTSDPAPPAKPEPAPAVVPEAEPRVAPAPAAAVAGRAVAANVAAAEARTARPWWHWAAGVLLLGMAVAAMMLGGVFSRGAQPVAATPAASAPAAISLQPGTGALQEQAAVPAGSSAAVAVAPVVAPVVAAPPVQSPASEPTPAPAPANDEPAVAQPMPEIKPATKPAAVAPVAKAAPKSEAKVGSQHDEIRRKKEELKRQLGLQ